MKPDSDCKPGTQCINNHKVNNSQKQCTKLALFSWFSIFQLNRAKGNAKSTHKYTLCIQGLQTKILTRTKRSPTGETLRFAFCLRLCFKIPCSVDRRFKEPTVVFLSDFLFHPRLFIYPLHNDVNTLV